MNLGLMVIVFAVMLLIVYKNINASVAKQKPVANPTLEGENIYKRFATHILEVIDDLKEATKNGSLAVKEDVTIEDTDEFYAETIRRAVYFETMIPRNSHDKKHEEHLFAILSDLDIFLEESYQDGEDLADEIKDKLQEKYTELQG